MHDKPMWQQVEESGLDMSELRRQRKAAQERARAREEDANSEQTEQ